MGRFAVMTLTDKAADRVREIIASRDGALGIRVGVKKVAAPEWNTPSISLPKPRQATM